MKRKLTLAQAVEAAGILFELNTDPKGALAIAARAGIPCESEGEKTYHCTTEGCEETKTEKIEATEAEVEKEYADMAEKYGMDVETVKKYLTADVVSDQIKSQKAIRIVTASATVAAPEEKAEEAEKAE